MTSLFERVARGQIVQAIRHLDLLNDQMRSEDAWNLTSSELCLASMAHVRYYVIGKQTAEFVYIVCKPNKNSLVHRTRLSLFQRKIREF